MAIDDESLPVRYISKLREYCIDYSDQESIQTIEFCPFCGIQLPPSLRDEWFDRLEALGLEPISPELPLALRDDRWWLQES